MCIAQLVEQWPFKPMSLVQVQVHPYKIFKNNLMKHNKHIFPQFFYSYMNETKCIRLISLSSKTSRYAFNLNCKIYYKNLFNSNKIAYHQIKDVPLKKNFISQYFK